MTKREIRILTIAAAHLAEDAVVYDIGAGTGSLSIEAALAAPHGHVYALERKAEGLELIQRNAAKFGAANLTAIGAEAPDGMEDLPPCDAAIIGGSGSHLAEILAVLRGKLRSGGRIVLNCITVQTLATALQWLREAEGFSYEAVSVQVNRLQQIGPYDMAKAENPIYIITAVKS